MKDYDLKSGDCLTSLENLPDECIDCTVTSPPYDNLRNYNGNISQWDFEKFKKIAKELFRVTKSGGVICWVVSDQVVNGSESGTSFRQALYFMECGFKLHDTMIWAKDTFSFPDPTRYRQSFEYIFVFSKGRPKAFNPIKDRKNKYVGTSIHGTSRNTDGNTFRKSNHNKSFVSEYGIRFNVWNIPTEKKNKTGHPAVFPLQIAEDLIVSWSNPEATIMDPFMGSGTTGIAAIRNNRNFLGMEIDETYFNMSKERIEEERNKQWQTWN